MLLIHLLQNWFSISELRGIVGRQALPLTPHRPIHVEIARLCTCIVEGTVGAAQSGKLQRGKLPEPRPCGPGSSAISAK